MDYFVKVLKNYATFTGRARRKEYWMYVLFYILFSIGVNIIDNVLGTTDPESGVGYLGGLYSLALLIPSLAVGARRLHDTGKTGWLMLLVLIPVIGWIVLLIFFIQDSQPGENKYGPNPKEGEVAI
ncbi:MAG: DUF805 domain-containing protein [Cryomorphaceae bacterium]|nr:MAG: DUF805 domain-containing protein [Cryomorphaceae bacterium]